MTPEEETLQKIKLVLSCGNNAQAIRLLEQYGEWRVENMYSKEELRKAFYVNEDTDLGEEYISFNKWFENFKKK
jgi:hypothetical protein